MCICLLQWMIFFAPLLYCCGAWNARLIFGNETQSGVRCRKGVRPHSEGCTGAGSRVLHCRRRNKKKEAQCLTADFAACAAEAASVVKMSAPISSANSCVIGAPPTMILNSLRRGCWLRCSTMSCMAGMVGHGQRQREFPLHALRQLRQTLAGVQRKALQQGLIPAFVPVFKEPGGDGGNFAHPPAGIADGAPRRQVRGGRDDLHRLPEAHAGGNGVVSGNFPIFLIKNAQTEPGRAFFALIPRNPADQTGGPPFFRPGPSRRSRRRRIRPERPAAPRGAPMAC